MRKTRVRKLILRLMFLLHFSHSCFECVAMYIMAIIDEINYWEHAINYNFNTTTGVKA